MESTRSQRLIIYKTIKMKEDFLHFVWQTKRFDLCNLTTTDGEAVEILNFGIHNHHAGPDFLNGRVRIAGTEWAGNIEMHLKASQWYAHNHQVDKAYDNVILHVVLEDDMPVKRSSGDSIPCLDLSLRIHANLTGVYQELISNNKKIPCYSQFPQVPKHVTNIFLDRILIERLEEKTALILEDLARNDQDWNAVCYKYIGRCFGLSVNTDAFEMLCHSLDWKILGKHKDQLLQVEALLFGQAGMLEKDFPDDYPQKLQSEYRFLQQKYGLAPIPTQAWKYMRMRPANLPSIRIAQFAYFIFKTDFMFSKLLAAKSVKELNQFFTLKLDNYWKTHYVFSKECQASSKSLGKAMIDLIIINGVVPLYFAYGISLGNEEYKERAIALMESIRPENNKITRFWSGLDMVSTSAAESQSLIHLKKHFCDQKQCLKCAVGNYVLKKTV